ncbi:unnamed protein product [Zymoseptoria tritici ST99CH_1E4]|uniref:Uncharacterized protein n=1 Tax=Zymoseptoria tritici ST99CH_1E4 TaxID=1276532 RepID=A0A2H1GAT7_ZYMTR|nr:unnamed protein product [Zymoseptoria tritici ST99CH_1E4]
MSFTFIRKQVQAKLKKSLYHPCQIRDFMEMRWTLLLLITLFRTMAAERVTDKDTWVRRILETAGTEATDGAVRVRTGRIVADIVATSQWGLQRTTSTELHDVDLTIDAIFAGVVQWTREVNRLLDQKVSLADQKKYNVEEACSSSEEEEESDNEPIENYEPSDKENQLPTSNNSNSPHSRNKNKNSKDKKTPNICYWTREETIALLKQYRDAPLDVHGRPATHQQVADWHNEDWFPDGAHKRTKVALQQQLKALVRSDRTLIPAKIKELEDE